MSPKGGTEALIKRPDLQGASQPASAPALSYCPQHAVLTGSNTLDGHVRLPGGGVTCAPKPTRQAWLGSFTVDALQTWDF